MLEKEKSELKRKWFLDVSFDVKSFECKKIKEPRVMAHAFSHSTWEVKADGTL